METSWCSLATSGSTSDFSPGACAPGFFSLQTRLPVVAYKDTYTRQVNFTNEALMQPIDKAIAILGATQDGQQLAWVDMKLVELAANDNLSEKGLDLLSDLYERVVTLRTYRPDHQYLFGIQHLTRDSQGYVYWKNQLVEHYSHDNAEDMQHAAKNLANRCLELESKGFAVTGRSAICSVYESAPADTPWRDALERFYSLFEGNGRHVAILYRRGADDVVVLEREKDTGKVRTMLTDSAYNAFHFVQNQGLRSNGPVNTYEELKGYFEASGLTPQDVTEAVTA